MANVEGIAVLGATGGLGREIVIRLSKKAPLSIGYCNSREKAEALADRVVAGGGRAHILQVDMRDSESVKKFFQQASNKWGGLKALVSATGPSIPLCPLVDVDDEQFKSIYETDVLGSFYALKYGYPHLKAAGGGSIVLFLTTAVLRTLSNDGMSGCPKTAVKGLLKQAAREMGPANVRCNGVAPGVIDAGIVHTSFELDEVAKSVIGECLGQTPLRRMGQPSEIASLVEYLVSDDAAYISGQIIAIDGGYSA